VALIATLGQDGKANLATLAEIFNVSIKEPVIIGIAIRGETYSHELIAARREFTVNFPSHELLPTVDGVGHVSGRDCAKFERFGLTPLPALHVAPPLVAECPLNLECRVISDQPVGDHRLILGEVLAEHVDADKVIADRPDLNALRFVSYAFGEYWGQARRLGKKGFSIIPTF
jgi:flavin reductase (DIM6/NTAB) family NADH-FMN oxidoreductase RutF